MQAGLALTGKSLCSNLDVAHALVDES
jgi:hypothetical protein